jgi:hypothetical protein
MNGITQLPTAFQSWTNYKLMSHLKQRQKYVQFVVFFPLLTHGHPIYDYESLKELFQLLKVKFVPENIRLTGWAKGW